MRISRSLTILGSVLIMTLGGVWIAHAAIPSADGTFTACISKSTGAVRIIDTATTSCKSSEILRTWNQQGQPGPPGLLSPDDLYTATNNINSDVLAGFQAASFCDEGDTVLGAHTVHVAGSDRWEMDKSFLTGTDAEGISVLVYDQGTGHGALVRAQCLDTAEPAHTP